MGTIKCRLTTIQKHSISISLGYKHFLDSRPLPTPYATPYIRHGRPIQSSDIEEYTAHPLFNRQSSLGFRDLFHCKVHRRSLLVLVSNSSFHARQYLLIVLHAASIDAPSPIYSIQPLRGQAVRRYNKRSANTAGESLQEGVAKFLIGLLWRLRDLYQLSPTSWEVSRRNLLYD